MRPLQSWLDAYGADHRNAVNQRLHWACVPAIFLSIVGLTHLAGRAGDVILLAGLAWYASLSARALGLMWLQLMAAAAVTDVIHAYAGGLAVPILLGIFVVAWVGQFYGHHLEGRRPSFFTDLQYLLIGPLWVWLGH